MTEERSHPQNAKKALLQVLFAVPISLVAFLLVVFVALLSFEIGYANRVYPGVVMDELDLSGLTLEEAGELIAESMSYSYDGKLLLSYKEQEWEVRPIDMGYLIDSAFNAQRAYDIGRSGWMVSDLTEKGQAWFSGVQISPVAYFNEHAAQVALQLEELAAHLRGFLLGELGHAPVLVHGLDLFHPADAAPHGLVVGQRAAEPAVGDVVHPTTGR